MSNRELARAIEDGPVKVKTSYTGDRRKWAAGLAIRIEKVGSHNQAAMAIVRWNDTGEENGISPSLLRFA